MTCLPGAKTGAPAQHRAGCPRGQACGTAAPLTAVNTETEEMN
jgi:hypothetical protein